MEIFAFADPSLFEHGRRVRCESGSIYIDQSDLYGKILIQKDRASQNQTIELGHPNIIRCLGIYPHKNHNYYIYEYSNHGSLCSFLGEYHKQLPFAFILQLAIDITQGMHFLQGKGTNIQIKSSNVLVDNSNRAKISFFDLNSIVNIKNSSKTNDSLDKMIIDTRVRLQLEDVALMFLGKVFYDLAYYSTDIPARSTLIDLENSINVKKNQGDTIPLDFCELILFCINPSPRSNIRQVLSKLKNMAGDNPFNSILNFNAMKKQIEELNNEKAKLLETTIQQNEKFSVSEKNIHRAAYQGNLQALQTISLEASFNVDEISKQSVFEEKFMKKCTALHLASLMGHFKVVEFLLSKRANVNATDGVVNKLILVIHLFIMHQRAVGLML